VVVIQLVVMSCILGVTHLVPIGLVGIITIASRRTAALQWCPVPGSGGCWPMMSSASSAPVMHHRFVEHMVEGTSFSNPETLRFASFLRPSFLDCLRGNINNHESDNVYIIMILHFSPLDRDHTSGVCRSSCAPP
jgi:hypothetical protein